MDEPIPSSMPIAIICFIASTLGNSLSIAIENRKH
jgi:hypothetical protein